MRTSRDLPAPASPYTITFTCRETQHVGKTPRVFAGERMVARQACLFAIMSQARPVSKELVDSFASMRVSTYTYGRKR